jgi:hypothetical protein
LKNAADEAVAEAEKVAGIQPTEAEKIAEADEALARERSRVAQMEADDAALHAQQEKAAAIAVLSRAPATLVTLVYNVPDAPAETPHQIYRFGDDGKLGAEVRSHYRNGRVYEAQRIRFTGVEVNVFESFGALMQAQSKDQLDVLLQDLANEATEANQ